MKDLKLLQVIPSLESGGAEQGTIDVANYIAEQGYESFVASRSGRMLNQLNRKSVKHLDLPVHSKNPFVMLQNVIMKLCS